MVILYLFTLSLALLALFLYNHYTYWQRRGVLQETPLPFVGNYKGLGSTYHMRDISQRLYRKFKGKAPFVGSYMFLQRSALILDLDLIRNILIKDFTYFHDRGAFNNVEDDPLTGHLLTLEGEEWKSLRAKLTPVFTSARMKFMFPTVVKVGEQLAESIGLLSNNDNNHEVEIKDLCARFTTDVIGTCAFGIECNSLKDPEAEFRLRGSSIVTKQRHSPLVMMFIVTNAKLAQKLRMKIFPDDLTKFFIDIVRQTVDYRIKNNVKCNDFMDLLIDLKAENDESIRTGQGIDLTHGLTIEQMAAQAFVFFLAGFETSSTTMSFCLLELAHNRDIQDRLRKEILEILEKSKGELTYEGLNSMAYLDQVLAETMRKYTVLSMLVRKTKQNYRVPDTDQVIEKDTIVTIPVHAIHHDPELYENPAKFDPSRFEPSEFEKRHPSSYLPFGDGPRNCIGLRFGKMQAKVGLVSLLQHYSVGVSTEKRTQFPVDFDTKAFLISAKGGIYLKVKPLKDSS